MIKLTMIVSETVRIFLFPPREDEEKVQGE